MAARERLVAKAIKLSQTHYGFPLIPREIALDAITDAENGTNYLEFIVRAGRRRMAQSLLSRRSSPTSSARSESCRTEPSKRPASTPLPTGVCSNPHTPHGRWNRPPVGRRSPDAP